MDDQIQLLIAILAFFIALALVVTFDVRLGPRLQAVNLTEVLRYVPP